MSAIGGLCNLLSFPNTLPDWVNRFCKELEEKNLSCNNYDLKNDPFSKFSNYGKHIFFPLLTGILGGVTSQFLFPFNISGPLGVIFSSLSAAAGEYSLQEKNGRNHIDWGKISSAGFSCLFSMGSQFLFKGKSSFFIRASFNIFQTAYFQCTDIALSFKQQRRDLSFRTFFEEFYNADIFALIGCSIIQGEGFHHGAKLFFKPCYEQKWAENLRLNRKHDREKLESLVWVMERRGEDPFKPTRFWKSKPSSKGKTPLFENDNASKQIVLTAELAEDYGLSNSRADRADFNSSRLITALPKTPPSFPERMGDISAVYESMGISIGASRMIDEVITHTTSRSGPRGVVSIPPQRTIVSVPNGIPRPIEESPTEARAITVAKENWRALQITPDRQMAAQLIEKAYYDNDMSGLLERLPYKDHFDLYQRREVANLLIPTLFVFHPGREIELRRRMTPPEREYYLDRYDTSVPELVTLILQQEKGKLWSSRHDSIFPGLIRKTIFPYFPEFFEPPIAERILRVEDVSRLIIPLAG